MNKDEFLQSLRRSLHGFSDSDIDEIIADYASHFDESTANGRSEEATAAALGDPTQLGAEHVADFRSDESGLLSAAKRLLAGALQFRADDDATIDREFTWKPGSSMTIGLPAHVTWQPADQPRATASGPAWLLEYVRVDSEHLLGRFKPRLFHHNPLTVTLEGPAIQTWSLTGSGDLLLKNLSQPSLQLQLNGSGDIKAAGRVDAVSVSVTGSGDVDLSLLAHDSATVEVTGSGDVMLAPRMQANLSIEGSGDVVLLAKPETLRANVSGGGNIRQR